VILSFEWIELNWGYIMIIFGYKDYYPIIEYSEVKFVQDTDTIVN